MVEEEERREGGREEPKGEKSSSSSSIRGVLLRVMGVEGEEREELKAEGGG